MKLCHNHKDQLCNKNTSTHPSWSTLNYYSLVWFKKDKLIYSKALEYVASRCSDLGDTQFWIGSKKTWHTGIVSKNQRISKIFLFKIFYTQLVLLRIFTPTPKLYVPSWVHIKSFKEENIGIKFVSFELNQTKYTFPGPILFKWDPTSQQTYGAANYRTVQRTVPQCILQNDPNLFLKLISIPNDFCQ